MNPLNNLNPISLLGNSSIGIFAVATSSFAILPTNTKPRVIDIAKSTLGVPIVQTPIAGCNLIGLFAIGNSNNLVLPGLTHPNEYNLLEKMLPNNVQIHILESKITALGNSIVASDDVALVHTEFTSDEKKQLADMLDVEIISHKLLDNPLVGSMIFRNANGILTHPLITYEELDWLTDLFKVKADVVTVNRGTPFPRPGLVGNEKGVLAGSDTTGPELLRIFEILLS